MATLKRRFTFSILFSFLSLTAILLLLARQRVSTHLQSLTLATGIHEYTGGIFRWDVEEEEEVEEGGVRMVVFGDSWADDKPESGMSGKGKSWVRTVCEEVSLRETGVVLGNKLTSLARSVAHRISTTPLPNPQMTTHPILQREP